MQVKWSEMKLPLGSIWAAIKTLQIDLPPFNNQTATPFSNRQCLSLCVCVCVRLCVPLTSATRSTPQVPQHALITINDGSQGGVRQRVRWLWWQHLLLPIWNFSKLAAPHPPPPSCSACSTCCSSGPSPKLVSDNCRHCLRLSAPSARLAIAFDLPTPFAMTINPRLPNSSHSPTAYPQSSSSAWPLPTRTSSRRLISFLINYFQLQRGKLTRFAF